MSTELTEFIESMPIISRDPHSDAVLRLGERGLAVTVEDHTIAMPDAFAHWLFEDADDNEDDEDEDYDDDGNRHLAKAELDKKLASLRWLLGAIDDEFDKLRRVAEVAGVLLKKLRSMRLDSFDGPMSMAKVLSDLDAALAGLNRIETARKDVSDE